MKLFFASFWRVALLLILVAVVLTVGGIAVLRFGLGGETVKVPGVVGKDLGEALELLNQNGLNLKIMEKKYNNRVPSGIIIFQAPSGGEFVRISRAVKVVVSKGSETVQVPDVIGMPVRQARMILRKAGVEIGWQADVHHPQVSKNYVVAQGLEPGSEVKRQDRIALLVSRGPIKSALIMADFIGRNLESVREKVKEMGLELGVVELKEDSRFKAGTIIKQNPPLGSRIAKGASVYFTVTRALEQEKKATRHFYYLRYQKQPGLLNSQAVIWVKDAALNREILNEELPPGDVFERIILVSGKPEVISDQEDRKPQLKNWKRDFHEFQARFQVGPFYPFGQLQPSGTTD